MTQLKVFLDSSLGDVGGDFLRPDFLEGEYFNGVVEDALSTLEWRVLAPCSFVLYAID
jgi:hypothetical protein